MLRFNDFVLSMISEEGLVSADGMQSAARHASERRVSVPEALVALGLIGAKPLAVIQAAVCEVPFVDLDHYDIDYKNSALLSRSAAEKLVAFPLFNLSSMDGAIIVGMADPGDLRTVDRVRALLKCEIEPVFCESGALKALIERAYSLGGGSADVAITVAATPDAADQDGKSEPIIRAVNEILAQAIEQSASDIHLNPDEFALHLRYRVDGMLQIKQGPSLASHPGLVQRIKVMSNLDLTQTRRPQDGKFRFTHAGRAVDVRVSIIPTIHGENVVMRLLAQGQRLGSFADLGVSGGMIDQIDQLVQKPHGMILVTGPTGSGKTTTLYTAINRLNTPDRNIITIEDPVELRLPLIRQVQVHDQIGLTFAAALRSILRQDPDVVLVGEIRDEETGRIAIQAALTGHLVLSTLHTNDAAAAIARLKDFGIPSFAINGSLLGSIAQRLLRRICQDCVTAASPDAMLLRRFGLGVSGTAGTTEDSNPRFRRGGGCPRCLSTGWRGRVGVYELMRLTPEVQDGVERGDSTAALRRVAIGQGMTPLWRDGLDKAMLGLTTLEEVARIAIGTLENDQAVTAGSAALSGRRAA